MRRLVLVLAIAGCGGEAPAPAPAPVTDVATELVDPGAGTGDAIVARVDGRPVWASCVTGHVRARAIAVDQALADCIDLELLAIAAVRRGLAADPETAHALRTALVDGFVQREFEARYKAPADLPAAALDHYVKLRSGELDRPELRTMVYARAPVQRHVEPGSARDLAAKALADEIYAELGTRHDLFSDDLFATAKRIAAGRPIETAFPRPGGLQEDFGAAAYAIPDIGQISPPTRTPWGWDLILITDLIPTRKQSRDQLLAAEAAQLVHWFFDQWWTRDLAATHAVAKFSDRLDETETAVPAPGSGAPR